MLPQSHIHLFAKALVHEILRQNRRCSGVGRPARCSHGANGPVPDIGGGTGGDWKSDARSRNGARQTMPPALTRPATSCARRERFRCGSCLMPMRPGPPREAQLIRMSGNNLPDNETMLALGRTLISTTIANEMKAPECSTVSRLTQQLEPLPPANFANVVALFCGSGRTDAEKLPAEVL